MIDTCPTCGQVNDRGKRLQEEASCLSTHRVREAFLYSHMSYVIAHLWTDEGVYAAVSNGYDPITDEEAMAWLDLVHRREVPIRPWHEGMMVEVDPLDLRGVHVPDLE